MAVREMTKLSLISKHAPVALRAHISPAPGSARFRVICATDLWGQSDHALQKALWLAETTDAELLLLHVVDGEAPLRLIGKRADHARRALEWRVRRWPRLKLRPAISVRVGNPHRIISRVARESRADLVVLGSSRPRITDRFLATTAERVAAEARCAVLIVNRSSREAYSSATVVATSGHQAAALELAAAKLHLLKNGAKPRKLHSVRESPDLLIVEADQWPSLTALFWRTAASKLARNTAADLLIAPHRQGSKSALA